MKNNKVEINTEDFSSKLSDISKDILNGELKTGEDIKQRVRQELSYEELVLLSSNVIVETVEKFRRDNPLALLKRIFEEMRKRDE